MSKIQLKAFAPPKICVPVMSESPEKVVEFCSMLAPLAPDCVEWRLDYTADLSEEALRYSLDEMNRLLPDETAILATYRTKYEGGEGDLLPVDYRILVEWLIVQDGIDLIDIELAQGDESVAQLIRRAKENQVTSVLSYHNFSETPDNVHLNELLYTMTLKKPDVVKIATMGINKSDYPRLAKLVKKWSSRNDGSLFIALVMGELGQMSRLEGEKFGSVMTFARVDKGSAPGQYTIEEVRNYLENASRDINKEV
ncbi:type I 3-dehydroquinate dehydratase [Vagococcus fessus]|uniref:3-dehydroquinate dehydratase n=1 Tax=Vagococcus fessus TaxID=120370 RepID=A0A430A5B6_9ENTE|nr:type I 3-dehydroquinate dehydratase [Vagococcus fessus]RSU02005.1 type I 3-dehydroquinate dehydratase [Vagococcus fessus]